MRLAPELEVIPNIIGKFNRAGLTGVLIMDLIFGKTNRDLISDAKKLSSVYDVDTPVDVKGSDNIPIDTGSLVVFNHPNMDILLPAMLKLMVTIYTNSGHISTFLQGNEIPLFGHLNDKIPLPGSVKLLHRFHGIYPDNIISVPISKSRKDYLAGRSIALRKTINALEHGNVIMIAPEGHVEVENTISPVETFHFGSGKLARISARIGTPVIPVGIWKNSEEKQINVNVGEPFVVTKDSDTEAVIFLMSQIALQLPRELRGPFHLIKV